ncbi:MAG: D-alanyl-D-alanine carboxypeptidase family protein [Bacillota bacterium]
MRDVNLLHPDLKPKALKLVELAKAKGINIVVSQTWRTKEEQDALYAQGRTRSGNKERLYFYSLQD